MTGPRLVSISGSSAGEKVMLKPAKRRAAVIDLIRSARQSLLLSVFRCDDLSVLHELGAATARGVRVEALVTGRAKGWGKRLGPLAGLLESLGVTVHRFPSGSMKYHAKFMVADETRALVGTANLTRKCFRRSRDFVLVTEDPTVVKGLTALFCADSKGAAFGAPSDRLVVGPDNARVRIEDALRNARQSVRIMDHKLSDPGILAILRDLRRRQVTVEIESGNGIDSLTAHGRLILVDQSIAIFGSLALSAKSLDERREVAVIVREPKLVAKLERQFDRVAATLANAEEQAA